MKKKNNEIMWPAIFCTSLLLLFVLFIVSSAMEIGEKLGEIHISLELIFYLLIVAIVVSGIIYPVCTVFFAPVFSLKELHDANGAAKKKYCRILINNLLNNVELSDDEKIEVESFAKMGDKADDKLIEFFDRKIRPEIDKEVMAAAKRAFLVTAVSQNALYDMLAVAVFNYNMIKKIITICGFRPGVPQVLKVYGKVLTFTIAAGAIEDLDVEDMIEDGLDEMLPDALGDVVGKVGGSIMQGAFNALATIRVAVVTKNYLLNADVSKTRKELRRQSFKEAMDIFRQSMKDLFDDNVGRKLKNFLGKVIKRKHAEEGETEVVKETETEVEAVKETEEASGDNAGRKVRNFLGKVFHGKHAEEGETEALKKPN